jgi:nucleotide-binding universal stress UspA family protein
MFKRVLVPLDTSSLAEIAIPYAEELAVKMGSEIILAHVRTTADAPDNKDHQVYMSKMTAELEQRIKKSAARPRGEKVKVMSVVLGKPDVITHPAEEILNYSENENISMILIATHGRTGISRWALGSTANKIASVFKRSVLLIRANDQTPRSVHMDKILVTLDGSQPSEAALPYAESLASKLKSKISLLNVIETPYHIYPYADGIDYYGGSGIIRVPFTASEMKPLEEVATKYIKGVNDKLAKEGIKTGYEVRVGSPAEEIIKIETESHPDLVVMSTHGHSGFGRFEHGSITDKVLHNGNTPLLLVHPEQKPTVK